MHRNMEDSTLSCFGIERSLLDDLRLVFIVEMLIWSLFNHLNEPLYSGGQDARLGYK